MQLFDKEVYIARRKHLLNAMDTGVIWLLGNQNSPRNFLDNSYHFRQDSTLLYYTGLSLPGLSLLMDVDDGEIFLCGDELTLDDIIWTGPQPTLHSMAERIGVRHVISTESADQKIIQSQDQGRKIHYLPPYRSSNTLRLTATLGISADDVSKNASESLIRSIINQRAYKSPEEIEQMIEALEISKEMHLEVMYNIRPGLTESDMVTALMQVIHRHGVDVAYTPIVTTNGQTLHNHSYANTMKSGDLLLGDFGAESSMCYAGDITRTLPVSGTFTAKQKEIYQLVLEAEQGAIDSIRPGVKYIDIHTSAAMLMAKGLKDLGLMKGDVSEAVHAGAHALFFPHGLGHMIGLDVHDMEDFGENLVGYDEHTERSSMFGYRSLRLGRKLEEGFVLTVEPGLYFIPELIDRWKEENKHEAFIDYEEVQRYRDFGGIRIEDNVLVTDESCEVLGSPIAKDIDDVEFLCALDKYVK